MEILCFFAGIAFFYLKSPYPFYFFCLIFLFRSKPVLLIWFLSALLWGFLHQWITGCQGMPSTNLIKNVSLVGTIASIPTSTPSKMQFQFLAEKLANHTVNVNILMACFENCPTVHAGEKWQLQATLKKPVNLANPGGFDGVAFLSARHIQWVGNVKRGSFKPITSASKRYPLMRLREHLAHTLETLVNDPATLGIFEALTLGLTTHVDKIQWDLFRRTGTTHLIDISGEHIALVAGLSYGLILLVWKRFNLLCLIIPAPKVASGCAILISIAYALIAGFAVPTQRALITCCLMFLRHFCGVRLSMWQAWRYALLLVLLGDPHSVFMLGFYFSFIAVAILILINQRFKARGFLKMLTMQLACMFGLMPLSLYWFSYASINGLIANLFAIPWVGFLIVPLALLIACLSPWGTIPGSIALLKWLIGTFLYCLRWIDVFETINVTLSLKSAILPLAIMAALSITVFLPLPRFFPAAGIVLLASIFPAFEKISLGSARIDVLDVGQGLAVVVRTAHHVLVYDTGMKFYQAGDMAKLVIIPYLNTLHIKQLDKIIISHPDLDHRGGLLSLAAQYPQHELIVDDPIFYQHGVSCHDYPAWEWDGIQFQFFPILALMKQKNNRSCILQIRNKVGQVLLSGDIEQPAEDYLIKTYGNKLQSSLLLIPHHGSKTSSSMAFVKQVSPVYAIASYGLNNRYHFPHQEAIKHYTQQHIPVYNTADCGMVRMTLQEGPIKPPQCYRTP